MGDAPPQIHVLDFDKFTSTELSGTHYHIAKDDSFTYRFDSTPLRGFTNLGGVLFVQYLQDASNPRPDLPRQEEPAPLDVPRSSNGTSSWTFEFDPKHYKDESDKKRGILVVLVLPKRYTAPVAYFSIRPRNVRSTSDSRICFLFIQKKTEGYFELRWRTTRRKFAIAKEVQRAFDEILKNPPPMEEIPRLRPYEAKSEGTAPAVVGRTWPDVVYEGWKRFGWKLIALGVALLLVLLAITHLQTEPGKRVSIFGIDLYTKGGVSDLRGNR